MVPFIEEQVLRTVCNVLGDTEKGLTGTEIGHLLSACDIEDSSASSTKRFRLFDALSCRQARDKCGNHVARFIQEAMNPVRYINSKTLFEDRKAELNTALAFSGLVLGDDGKLRQTTAAETLSQAEQRATRLRRELLHRQVHPDVLSFCRAELLQDNYFHAVFEATKSVADKIRQKSGLSSDGARLVDEAFVYSGASYPLLVFNSLQSESERSEHNGLVNLMRGMFGAFRNVTAHAPKIKWTIPEQDALDMLSLASFLHRKLDNAIRIR
jgi:uncharacterized protein (TIGR02391 family)